MAQRISYEEMEIYERRGIYMDYARCLRIEKESPQNAFYSKQMTKKD